MRKLLNTLYVTRAETYLRREGMDVVVSVEQKDIFRIPIINLDGIVAFGYMGVSPGLMKLCVDNNVLLTFMSPSGQYISRLQGASRGNVLLRKRQYRMSDDKEFCLSLARIIIAGKIQNSRNILRRAIRDNGENLRLEQASEFLNRSAKKALNVSTREELLGVEGDAANTYFGVFGELILRQKEEFKFNGRSRRPPRDEVNIMLSFIYTMLANEATSALESVGLDPYVGFLHALRPGRASLALDMIEELRGYLADRLVLSMINRMQITKKDFIRQGTDMILLSEEGRQKVISAWQERKRETITHPFLGEKMPLGIIWHIQALLLSRYIRGDIENYPVFVMR